MDTERRLVSHRTRLRRGVDRLHDRHARPRPERTFRRAVFDRHVLVRHACHPARHLGHIGHHEQGIPHRHGVTRHRRDRHGGRLDDRRQLRRAGAYSGHRQSGRQYRRRAPRPSAAVPPHYGHERHRLPRGHPAAVRRRRGARRARPRTQKAADAVSARHVSRGAHLVRAFHAGRAGRGDHHAL
ncbi:unknown [Alistipes finegoldii CAG:68]|nr:unknown [Alistipes finegoldii CAG:68]